VAAIFTVAIAAGPEDMAALRALFEAYATSLPIDLDYQGFAGELAGLPGKYAPPRGALLLARDGAGAAAGCVALRPLGQPGYCEMKRLYVVPAVRGEGLGRRLAEAIIEQARRIGYRAMRLDTLASMEGALSLYRSLGFLRVEAYYAPTPAGTVFMERPLQHGS
jgi:ribosomal protein S18 acetylase RimI-like enzyme